MVKRHLRKKIFGISFITMALFYTGVCLADSTNMTVGGVASQVVGSMEGLAQLITAGSLVAGMGFAVGAVLKFKQHKDNPTQIPVGTPIALIFIAAALIFLPTIFGTLGQTLFSSNAQSGGLDGNNPFIKGGSSSSSSTTGGGS